MGQQVSHAFGSGNYRFTPCGKGSTTGNCHNYGVGPGDYYDKHYTIGEKNNTVVRDKKLLGNKNKYAVYQFPRDSNSKLRHAINKKRGFDESDYMPDLRSPSQTTRQFSKNNKKPSARLIVNSLEKHSMGNSTDTWENIQKSDIKAPMNTKEDLFEQNANLRNSLNSKLRDYNIDMVNASNDNRPLSFLEQKKIKKAFKTS